MILPFLRERKIHFVSSIFLCTYTALLARSFVSQTPQHEKLYPLHHNTVFEFGQYKGMTLDQIAQENASYILWCTRNIKKKINIKATTQHLIRLLCTIQLFTNTQGSPAIAVCCLHACAFKCPSQACSDNLSCI